MTPRTRHLYKTGGKLWLILVVWLLMIAEQVHASLKVSINETTLTLNTATFYGMTGIDYQRQGMLIRLPLKQNNCEFETLNASIPLVQTVAMEAGKSPDTGIFIPWPVARTAGCKSIAQVADASLAISTSLTKIGFPPVSYLAIMSDSPHFIDDWGPNTALSDGIPMLSTTAGTKHGLAVALLNQWDTKRLYDSIKDSDYFPFVANYDAGAWNSLFMSSGYNIFLWVCFSLIILGAAGGFARSVWYMIRGAYFYGDSRTVLLVVALITAIISAISLQGNLSFRIETILKALAFCLSCCSFALLCWYWSYRVTEHISSKVLVAFRAFLAVTPVVSMVILILHGISDNQLSSKGVVGDLSLSTPEILIYYVTLTEIPITTAGFACFGAWFLKCSFKQHLGKLSRRHATELSLLCFSQAILFGMSTAISVSDGVNSQGLRYGTVLGALCADIVNIIIITVQTMVAFLAPPVPLKCHELMDEDFTAQLVTTGHPNRTSMVSIWKPSHDKSSGPSPLGVNPRRVVP
ncbi:hypothetical protein BDF22DRAFT_12534 [Syncephalis plumigaleata]|nr:hypothetical protein BDF22DRAFT_12534 [Syncephalis plumigaleata]